LFSDPREDVKAAKRAIAEDNYLKGAEKAWKSNDLEMHKKYMDSYSKINGLEIDKEDGGLAELMKKLPPQQIILNFKKEDLEGAAEVLREQITDIEHEEV
jgi:hypothetical protein